MEDNSCGYEEGNCVCTAEAGHDGPHVLRTWQESLYQGLVSLVMAGGLR
jgi:hypothetical protein